MSWIRAHTPLGPDDRSDGSVTRLRGERRDWTDLAVVVGLALLSFLQRPGDTTSDTKFDLTADPGRFLERALHLWNPQASFGELQNQAYGYLFPQGPFFLLGDLAGIPAWVHQRLWSALILVAAYEGARRLHRALAPGQSPRLATVAGLAYALAPRLLGLSGVLTAEILPTAVLPWVVLPLVLALRGRITVPLGALLSGAAVLLMGGVNAVEDLATFPLPALVLVCSLGTPVGRRLALWWVGAVALASAWWLLPLLVLGKYSPPFLDYIETSTATTRPLGWVNVTRGADHWLGFVNLSGQKWWPGAYDLAIWPHLIVATALVGAISLAGLFHPSMPARLPLGLSALLGMVLLTVGHDWSLGSPLSEQVRTLLDGSLAPLRNVHKVDPLVRLPLALGFAHALGVLLGLARRPGPRAQTTRLRSLAVGGAVVGLLLVSAQPLFAGDLRKPGWDTVPRAWYQAADYLHEHADGLRALVVPGSSFGQQTWGWTLDEPIQGLARSPWVTRSQVPLTPGQTIRFLDSLEDRVQDGLGSPAFADTLARAGVGYVVVRRDLDLYSSGAPTPARVDQAIARSPGLAEVASFGSTGLGDQPMVSIFAVRRPVPRVEAVETDSVASFAGGPEDVITLLENGALAARRPAMVSSEPGAVAQPDLVGDGYRRRERQFGRLNDSLSQIMTATESYRILRRAHDYPGVPGIGRVTAVYPDINALSASSSSGYADTLGAVRPELGPYSAVDGTAATYWRSAPLENPRGQWLEVRLKRPEPLTRLDVTVGVDTVSGVPVRRIRVDAGGQVSEHAVDPDTGVVRVSLTGAPVDRVRVTVLATYGDPQTGVVAIREIGFPGLRLGRQLAVPDAGATDATGFVFTAEPERRACVETDGVTSCDAAAARPSEEEAGLDRTFRTGTPGGWTVSGTVQARATPETAQLLFPVGPQVQVAASSVLADDPAVSGQFALDGDPGSDWLSARGDHRPRLVLRWGRPRTLTRLQVIAPQQPARSPVAAVLEADGQRRRVDLGAGSLGLFAPLRTDHVTITFLTGPASGETARLPVGVGELVVDGLTDLAYEPDPATPTGAACGLGPDVVVDGHTLRTRVVGRLADVIGGAALRLEPCGHGVVRLAAGDHDLAVTSTPRFLTTALTLEPVGGSPVASDSTVRTRRTEIRHWGSNDRSVYVGPGAEALLRVPENTNAGWRATLDGKVLTATRLDGWQQAYRLPAGEGGLVRLTFQPDRPYRLALLVGAVAAVLLLAGCAWTWWRDRARIRVARELPPALTGRLPSARAALAVLVATSWLVGGTAFLAGVVLGLLLRRRPGLRQAVAVVVVGGAGVAAGVVARVDAQASWTALDALTGGAIGMLLAALCAVPGPEGD